MAEFTGLGIVTQCDTVSATAETTLNGASIIDLDSMVITLTTGSNYVYMDFACDTLEDVTSTTAFRFEVDGVDEETWNVWEYVATRHFITNFHLLKKLSSGTHTFKVQWNNNADGNSYVYSRRMTIIEFKR